MKGSTLVHLVTHGWFRPDIFDEYTRRQYVAKAPERNPFGVEEMPRNFLDFDIFTKLSVLCQLSRWTFVNSDRMREKMSETMDLEQIQWVSSGEALLVETCS